MCVQIELNESSISHTKKVCILHYPFFLRIRHCHSSNRRLRNKIAGFGYSFFDMSMLVALRRHLWLHHSGIVKIRWISNQNSMYLCLSWVLTVNLCVHLIKSSIFLRKQNTFLYFAFKFIENKLRFYKRKTFHTIKIETKKKIKPISCVTSCELCMKLKRNWYSDPANREEKKNVHKNTEGIVSKSKIDDKVIFDGKFNLSTLYSCCFISRP